MTLRLVEHTLGFIYEVGCKRRIGTVRLVLASCYCVALALYVVAKG